MNVLSIEREKLWKSAVKIWKLDNEFCRVREFGKLLDIKGNRRYETVRSLGLQRPHKREAFFARLASLRRIEQP